ncbi:phospholipase D-like domain-containing protein [Acinetobacter sp. KS-LM10]|uniref:phospholipase D-like domain-containing protein n=1 Tax=Acinetobacter sp. KS-LM10 TaxID=3120518 RepID=UPI0030D1C7FA
MVNDDELNYKKSCDFHKVGMEYHQFSPINNSYKNLMHHKFCIIDLKKVITDSFNWTEKANFNFENI